MFLEKLPNSGTVKLYGTVLGYLLKCLFIYLFVPVPPTNAKQVTGQKKMQQSFSTHTPPTTTYTALNQNKNSPKRT